MPFPDPEQPCKPPFSIDPTRPATAKSYKPGRFFILVALIGGVAVLGPAVARRFAGLPAAAPVRRPNAVPSGSGVWGRERPSSQPQQNHDRGRGPARPTGPPPYDGKSLWEPLYQGQPIEFPFLPRATQVLIYLRPRQISSNDEGRRWLTALGPWVDGKRIFLEKTIQAPLAHVEELFVAISAGESGVASTGWPADNVVVALRLNAEDLPSPWRSAWAAANDSPQQFVSTATPNVRVFVSRTGQIWLFVGTDATLPPGESLVGQRPRLKRDLERLRLASDRRNQVTLLGTPGFVTGDGRQMFGAEGTPLKFSAATILGDGCQAASFAIGWTPQECYWEVRAIPSWEARYALRSRIRKAGTTLAGQVETSLASLNEVPAYWQRLVVRFPAMLRFAATLARLGSEQGQIIANGSLPRTAVHNLTVGTEMSYALQLNLGSPPNPDEDSRED